MGWAQIVTLAPYGERFRDMRRLIHKTLGARSQDEQIKRYFPLEEYEAHRFLKRLLTTPEDYVTHIRTLVVM